MFLMKLAYGLKNILCDYMFGRFGHEQMGIEKAW